MDAFEERVTSWTGSAEVLVKGIWYDEEMAELELLFTRVGISGEFRVKAVGSVDASDLSQFKFSAPKAVHSMFGIPALDLADLGNVFCAKDVFCDSLKILESTEIDTDEF